MVKLQSTKQQLCVPEEPEKIELKPTHGSIKSKHLNKKVSYIIYNWNTDDNRTCCCVVLAPFSCMCRCIPQNSAHANSTRRATESSTFWIFNRYWLHGVQSILPLKSLHGLTVHFITSSSFLWGSEKASLLHFLPWRWLSRAKYTTETPVASDSVTTLWSPSSSCTNITWDYESRLVHTRGFDMAFCPHLGTLMPGENKGKDPQRWDTFTLWYILNVLEAACASVWLYCGMHAFTGTVLWEALDSWLSIS